MVPSGGIRGARHKLGGRPAARPHQPAAPSKKRVLFVCIGNSCRSQMAEGFARAYGADVIDAHSAGVSPSAIIAPLTRQVLEERNIKIDGHFPKGLEMVAGEAFDVVVNMSGERVALTAERVIDWPVTDPIGQKPEVYRSVAGTIEGLVMRLILELRAEPLRNPS
jgi:arsenate reductase